MSLMGYTEVDIMKQMHNIRLIMSALKTKDTAEVRATLQETYDFLEGLVIEGRV